MTQPTADFTDQIPLVDVSTLTDEQRAEARSKHDRLFAWLAQYPRDNTANGGIMLSRHNEMQMWEATGFHIVPETSIVNAKVGRHPYQPIGQDDGQHFIPMEHSQRLWCREFALASLRPIASCFTVEETGYRAPAGVDDALLDVDRTTMQEALDVLKEALNHEGKPEGPEKRLSLFDTLQLAVMQTPRLDRYITAQEERFFSITGHDMMEQAQKGGELAKVVFSITEWLDMKLQEDAVRRTVENTILTVPEQTPAVVQGVWLGQIEEALKGGNSSTMAGTLNFLRIASPELRPVIIRGLEGQATATTILEACRAALSPTQSPALESTPPAQPTTPTEVPVA